MRLAFTSCIDPLRDPHQEGWTFVEQHDPTHLLLLGDNIYMDYGWWGPRRNGSPRKLGVAEFSARMRDAYERQWRVATFRRLIERRTVHATWDDHDFAWNNARGGGDREDEDHVPPTHRAASRLHFAAFREALSADPKPDRLPPDPAPGGIPCRKIEPSVAMTTALGPDIRMHVLDARTFRERPGGSLLGEQQRSALEAALLPMPGINLLASSSTVAEWKEYPVDFDWLDQHARSHRILVLSGDKHRPQFRAEGRLYEATASALAQPPRLAVARGRRTHVFGIFDVRDDSLELRLFIGDRLKAHHCISRTDWSLTTKAT
jgi:hypothetical protein